MDIDAWAEDQPPKTPQEKILTAVSPVTGKNQARTDKFGSAKGLPMSASVRSRPILPQRRTLSS
jgi:hypothetical protein